MTENKDKNVATITKEVSQRLERMSIFPLAMETFNSAYAELRRVCPDGNLIMTLRIYEGK